MLDIKFLRNNPELVKENIRKKFQDRKVPLVDQAIELDVKIRDVKQKGDELRAKRNLLSGEIGKLMREKKVEEANETKKQVQDINLTLNELESEETKLSEELKKIMMVIPNMIDPTVPIGKDDSQNVELKRFLEPKVPNFEVPYHLDIIERVKGIDLDSARRVAGNGFYYLMGNIARLHSAVLTYARDFMINKGFTYCIPPYMIRSNVVLE